MLRKMKILQKETFLILMSFRPDTNYIRMDTHAGNSKLNAYYEKCGFKILGETSTGIVPDLPAHYQNERFTLFDIDIHNQH